MKNLLIVLASFVLASPVSALSFELEDEQYYTNHSLGCLMMRECIEGVVEVKNIKDVQDYYSHDVNHSLISNEFNSLVKVLNEVNVKVYIAPQKFFPVATRGVYYTVGNNIFLNDAFMQRSRPLMSVMRHEAWHTVQDCMAGSIDNGMIAIVFPEENVPKYLKSIVDKTYSDEIRKGSIVWEREAWWAAREENMTYNALKVCRDGPMWETYKPTPLTRKYLIDAGYISDSE